jgi:mannose/fructose/N-acetylgalactosamine-specific phosphotransferase system component IID
MMLGWFFFVVSFKISSVACQFRAILTGYRSNGAEIVKEKKAGKLSEDSKMS